MHEWLPLQDHYHVYSASTDLLYPSCQRHLETVDHFLACTQQGCSSLITDLHDHLKHHLKNNAGSNQYPPYCPWFVCGTLATTPMLLPPLSPALHNFYQE